MKYEKWKMESNLNTWIQSEEFQEWFDSIQSEQEERMLEMEDDEIFNRIQKRVTSLKMLLEK